MKFFGGVGKNAIQIFVMILNILVFFVFLFNIISKVANHDTLIWGEYGLYVKD